MENQMNQNLEKLRMLIAGYLPRLEEVYTFEQFYRLCTDFYFESPVARPVELIAAAKNQAALEQLKHYPYPADFINWHENYGSNYLWLESTKLISTTTLVKGLEGFHKVLAESGLLLITTDGGGNLFVYDTHQRPARICFLDDIRYYSENNLEEMYSEYFDFWAEKENTYNNPRNLNIAEILDEEGKYILSSPYIKEYLLAQLQPVENASDLLQFLVSKTKEGFQNILQRYSNTDEYLVSELRSSWTLHHNKGIDYINADLKDLAIRELEKAIHIDPNAKSAYLLGMAFSNAGEQEQAMNAYYRALELDPSHSKAYNNLACMYYDRGDYEKALELAEKAIAADPTNALAASTKAEIAFALSDPENFYRSLRTAILLGYNATKLNQQIIQQLKNDTRFQKLLQESQKNKL